MSRQYPIWVEIDSCVYNQKKSYGVKNHSTQTVFAGTSSKNSHLLGSVELSHKELDNGDRAYTIKVDGIVVKRSVLRSQGEKLETVIQPTGAV